MQRRNNTARRARQTQPTRAMRPRTLRQQHPKRLPRSRLPLTLTGRAEGRGRAKTSHHDKTNHHAKINLRAPSVYRNCLVNGLVLDKDGVVISLFVDVFCESDCVLRTSDNAKLTAFTAVFGDDQRGPRQ